MSYDKVANKKKQVIEDDKDIYPKSINGKQCIGPCYFKGTNMSHPVSLDEIVDATHDFCPVNPYIHVDSKTGKRKIVDFATCYPPTARKEHIDEINLLSPLITFDSEYFIKTYYKLFSLDDILHWLYNHKN